MSDTITIEELTARFVPGSKEPPWTWDDEAADLHSHPCPTTVARAMGVDVDPCDDPEPGCYQRRLEAHIASVGKVTQGICLGPDGRVWDGHHRIVAAIRLGLTEIPLEPAE